MPAGAPACLGQIRWMVVGLLPPLAAGCAAVALRGCRCFSACTAARTGAPHARVRPGGRARARQTAGRLLRARTERRLPKGAQGTGGLSARGCCFASSASAGSVRGRGWKAAGCMSPFPQRKSRARAALGPRALPCRFQYHHGRRMGRKVSRGSLRHLTRLIVQTFVTTCVLLVY